MKTSSLSAADGLPSVGDFSGSEVPWGTHNADGWRVAPEINVTRPEMLFGNREVRAFQNRPRDYDAMLKGVARERAAHEAVVCGDRRVTWAQLDELVDRNAHGLRAAGLKSGERVAVMLDNRLEFIVSVLACVRAGGIAVPLGTRLGPSDVAHIVGHAEPAFAITANDWAARFPKESSVRRTYIVDLQDAAQEQPRTSSFDSLATGPAGPLPEIDPEATMMIIYTSGTTGKPKGACLTHVNFVHTCLHYLYALALDTPQRSLLVVPATHIAGFGPLLSVTLATGGTVVLMREFKARAALELIARDRITYAVLVPAMYQLCAREPTLLQHDLLSWRYGIYGGAIMPPAVIERFSSALPHLRMINAYGATETCAVCTIMPPELTTRFPASVGRPLECDDIIVVDAEGNHCDAGVSGEILVRGPNVFLAYWNDPAATAQAFSGSYWRSGDIGMRDDEGLLYVQDRLKDMINRGGFKVFSAEVENALMAHPDVADCSVVGVPDEVLGERTFALVQLRGAGLDAGALRQYLLDRIADYKVPDFFQLGIEAVPRNQNGKHQKAEVRSLALAFLAARK